MKYLSEIYMKNINRKNAFTLIETLTALAVLALICSSVLVIINRNIAAAADSATKMRAFEIARENLETLLARSELAESVDFGQSEKYPDIEWKTTVETFYEPVTSSMWLQGLCQATYIDSKGGEQSIELTHWLTNLSKKQILDILAQKQQDKEFLKDQIVNSVEAAAEYAGVDVEIMKEWLDKGMLTTEDGRFIKNQLDLFVEADGSPAPEDIQLQAQADADIIEAANEQRQNIPTEDSQNDGAETITLPDGTIYTITEIDRLPPEEQMRALMELLKNLQE